MRKKKIKLNSSFLYHMPIDDYHVVVNRILIELEEKEFTDSFVKDQIERVRSYDEVFAIDGSNAVYHDNTKTIREMVEETRQLLISLRMCIDGHALGETEEVRSNARTLQRWISNERKHFGTFKAPIQMVVVAHLLVDYNKQDEVRDALDALHLTARFEKIVENDELRRKLDLIRNSDKIRVREKIKGRKKNSYDDLTALLKTLLYMAYSDNEQSPMYYSSCGYIRNVLTGAHAIEKFRKTMREKKKAREREKAENAS